MNDNYHREEISLDPERQEQAREYARISRRLILVDLAAGGFYITIWLLSGWSSALRDALLATSDWLKNEWLLVAAFTAVFGGIYGLLSLPLGYYSGFVLPHRYGQSNQTLKGWITDQIKGLLVSAPLGLLVVEVIYLVLRRYPQTWWLWAAGFLLLFSVVLANLAPVLLMPIFYKFVPLGDERKDLEERLLALAKQAGTKVRGVYKFDMSRRSKSANAALTGLGSTRRILLGDTLLEEFSDDEIETVLAHELAHHVHHDIPIGMAVETVMTTLGLFLASLVLEWGVTVFGFRGPADVAALPLFVLVMSLYGLVTMPLGNWFSRWREQRADQYALKATGKSTAFATAMTRLANQNLAEVNPEPWVVFLLYSHPPLSRRIAMAEAYREEKPL